MVYPQSSRRAQQSMNLQLNNLMPQIRATSISNPEFMASKSLSGNGEPNVQLTEKVSLSPKHALIIGAALIATVAFANYKTRNL